MKLEPFPQSDNIATRKCEDCPRCDYTPATHVLVLRHENVYLCDEHLEELRREMAADLIKRIDELAWKRSKSDEVKP